MGAKMKNTRFLFHPELEASNRITAYADCTRVKMIDGEAYTVQIVPFRWGGLTYRFGRPAREWIRLEQEMNPYGRNVYKEGCTFCGEQFPENEPIYAVIVEDDNGMSRLKLLCKDCAYLIAEAMQCKIKEPKGSGQDGQ